MLLAESQWSSGRPRRTPDRRQLGDNYLYYLFFKNSVGVFKNIYLALPLRGEKRGEKSFRGKNGEKEQGVSGVGWPQPASFTAFGHAYRYAPGMGYTMEYIFLPLILAVK